MKSVRLLNILSHHNNHLQGQPMKVLVDILSKVWDQRLCCMVLGTLRRFQLAHETIKTDGLTMQLVERAVKIVLDSFIFLSANI